MDILFEKIPYDPEDEESDTYIGISADECFDIHVDKDCVGRIWLSYDRAFPDGDEYLPVYIEWIEFCSRFQNKHLLRPVMEHLLNEKGAIYLESTKGLEKKYEHIGCKSLGEDRFTGLTRFSYTPKNEEK